MCLFNSYTHRLIGSWVTWVKSTLFLAEFPLVFWLKVGYNFLPLFLAFSPHPLYSFTNIVCMLDCLSFAVCIELILCCYMYHVFMKPLRVVHISIVKVGLSTVSCYKLLGTVIELHSLYGANLPYTAPDIDALYSEDHLLLHLFRF